MLVTVQAFIWLTTILNVASIFWHGSRARRYQRLSRELHDYIDSEVLKLKALMPPGSIAVWPSEHSDQAELIRALTMLPEVGQITRSV